ncbi:ArnT family glycosyltransferase [Leisingera sp. ANG-M1]|uniref:ArnT family glycosyltransferase n=1 Tax=Leisingera sp. ANG-M1 TaxID=1577895 RepID=UPI000B1A6EC7|nr:glycosyltransferase family 39 protein [Leisingera sp. ANG-M1]
MPQISEQSPGKTGDRSPKETLSLSRTDTLTLLSILGALALVRLLAIFTLPFTDTTEARYAEIARKMVETGDWITPQFDYGVPFWGKPPLHTWLSAAGMELFGVNGFGARIFIFACALLLLGMLFRWVRQEAGSGAALVSVTVLASSVLFFGASAFVMTDLVMTLGVAMAMIGLWNCLHSENGSRFHGWFAFAGLAIGLLAKGPVAVVLCGIPAVLWGLVSGRWREAGKLPWVSGLALLLLLSLPWYVAAELKTPGFLNYFLVGEHFERFTVPDWQGDLYGNGHERPKGAIWGDWVLAFLPWSLVLVPMLFTPRRLVRSFRGDRLHWRSYLLCWALSPLLLFTASANILAAYTLPGLPAAAVLLVLLCTDAWRPCRLRAPRVLFAICSVFVIFTGGFYATLAQFAPHAVNLRSEKELVRKKTEISSQSPLYYIGKRSYSAEFYTRGQARNLPDLAAVQQLPQEPHALAIPQSDEFAAAQHLVLAYQRIGQYGRHVLYYSSPIREGALK